MDQSGVGGEGKRQMGEGRDGLCMCTEAYEYPRITVQWQYFVYTLHYHNVVTTYLHGRPQSSITVTTQLHI